MKFNHPGMGRKVNKLNFEKLIKTSMIQDYDFTKTNRNNNNDSQR
jgi:hypothetical protein